MPKSQNNPVIKGLSGMLGDVIVFREQRGQMVVSNKPKKSGTLTSHQKAVRARFFNAAYYAKGQIKIPDAKAEYETAISNKLPNAYSVAMADYLRAPEITQVDFSRYTGKVNDAITVFAADDFKVTGVTVEIRSATDVVIEQGDAVPDPSNYFAWIYTATQAVPDLHGTKIIVRAKDKPNNVTVMETVIGALPPGDPQSHGL
jgi:hypothetical protein